MSAPAVEKSNMLSTKKIYRLVPSDKRRQLPLMLLTALCSAVFDLVGIAALVSVLLVVLDENFLTNTPIFAAIYATFGFTSERAFIVAVCVAVLVLIALLTQLINHTKIGMAMRAVSKDFETARLMGIKINKVISTTFIIGSALAVVGSILYFTTYPAITPTAGAMPGLKSFVAAVFGGIGSIPGAVIGAFLIGICETIIKGLPSSWNVSVFSDAFTFALLIIILTCKPTGLFGEKATDKV